MCTWPFEESKSKVKISSKLFCSLCFTYLQILHLNPEILPYNHQGALLHISDASPGSQIELIRVRLRHLRRALNSWHS